MSETGEVVDVPAPPQKPPRGRKPKQEHLPGQEPQAKIAAVHNAIEAYVEVRDQRMQLTELEVQKRTLLGEVMKKHGLTKYAVDGHLAEIESEEKIKAKLKSDEEEGEPLTREEIDREVENLRKLKPKKRGREAAAGAD